MGKITFGSFFAGVGGIDLGFELTNKFRSVYANEFDEYPAKTFEANFNLKVDVRDINDVKGDEIPDFEVMCGGFPCQAFSVAGLRQGFNDEKARGTLFFEMVRIIKEKKAKEKQPRVVFLENVKNLVGHDNGNTFQVIRESLEELGYYVQFQVLNACEYGNVPQNRERIYIVAFLDKSHYDKFHFPLPQKLTNGLDTVIDFDAEVDNKYYYTPDCAFYDKLVEGMQNRNTVYQWRRVYVRENKSNCVPTLTANMGTGGHNVPLILTNDGKIRKLTPRECFNIQGFPRDFVLPEKASNTRLYKQAGNSVVVPVIKRIAEAIADAIK